MALLETPEALEGFRQEILSRRDPENPSISICAGAGCVASGADEVIAAFEKEIEDQDLSATVATKGTGCPGFCEQGPVVMIYPQEICYLHVQASDVPEIVARTIREKQVVERLCYKDPVTGERAVRDSDIPFYKSQQRTVLCNNIRIDSKSIEDYIALGGYSALAKALGQMTDLEVLEEVKKSNIRGRGGAGFPAGRKWEGSRNADDPVKYVIVNADEGDPGAFMDRALLEGNPHSILEGLILGGYAVKAHEGYFYVRQEYPLAVENIHLAIKQAEQYGLLGENILNSGFDFKVHVHQGAGAFVCGESTALMTSLEGKAGEPRPKYVRSNVKGLWERPSVLNNVETWANIPLIINNGADWFTSVGTESSKGTKIFSLVGKISNTGLVEVPMGMTLREIIYGIGGGIPNGKKFKAVQTGGPSGGCIPGHLLDLQVGFDELTKAGSMMGSGGMIVLDEDTCMVDMARYFIEFLTDESCGKCVPCREGLRQMHRILTNITRGEGREGDIELLEQLAETAEEASLCALGKSSPNPLLSTLRYFMDEYRAHIYDKKCPAGVCGELFKSPCQNACPVEMDVPAYIALVRADRLDDAYRVLKQTNPFPSVCGRVCGHPCQSKCRRSQLDESLAIKNLKRFITDHANPPSVTTLPVIHTEKIAVIGAGPGGLTAALEMRRRGYDVTVFEALPEAGGMLRWGIPSYRLPREILAREIQDILDTGVVLKTGVKIGRDMPFSDLESRYDAIYFGTGAPKSLPLGLANETADGVMGALEYLREYNLGQPVTQGKHVAVIGGGNSAVDAARTAVRMGAESVTVIYRREQKDMPAYKEEIQAAQEEGVAIECLAAPVEIKVENGRVCGLKLSRMELGSFDASGRRRPVAVEGGEFEIPVDTLIPAIGQMTELDLFPEIGEQRDGYDKIMVHGDFSTDHPRVWAGGDVVTGPAMVIDAIAAGQKAAMAMDRALRAAKGEMPWEKTIDPIEIPFEVDEDSEEQPQAKMAELAPGKRCNGFDEVELGYDRETAVSEARRCIRCDVKIVQ